MVPRFMIVPLCYLVLCIGLIGNSAAQTTPTPLTHFGLYEQNRRQGIANYITEDFLLTSYFLIQLNTQTLTEMSVSYPSLQQLLNALASALKSKKGEITTLNRDYIAILQALLSGQTQLPHAGTLAQAELKQILTAPGITHSPLWGVTIDYSQFKPRGPYTKMPQTQQYFRAFRYASTVLFAIQASEATGVSEALANRYIQQAMQLVKLIDADEQAKQAYQAINDLFDWSMGDSDDLTGQDLLEVIHVEPDLLHQPKLLRKQLLAYAKTHQRQPRIMAGVVDRSRLASSSVADVQTGWRLLPARYSADVAALQQLVFDHIGEYQAQCDSCQLPFSAATIDGKIVKAWPRAHEMMALLGSDLAHQQLRQAGDQDYQAYAQAWQSSGNELIRAQGLAAQQFLLMRQWLTDSNAIPESRRLNSMLVFWTWQRYLRLLYDKPSYTLNGKSLIMEPQRQPGAWLAPATHLYQALLALVASHQRHTPHPAWQNFAKLLERCLTITWRIEQHGRINSDDEYFLNELDVTLHSIVGMTDQPIVVDVHTNPATGEVLEQAVGFAKATWLDRGRGQRARGSLSTHYEFKQALSNRLDNVQWQTLLRHQPKKISRGSVDSD